MVAPFQTAKQILDRLTFDVCLPANVTIEILKVSPVTVQTWLSRTAAPNADQLERMRLVAFALDLISPAYRRAVPELCTVVPCCQCILDYLQADEISLVQLSKAIRNFRRTSLQSRNSCERRAAR